MSTQMGSPNEQNRSQTQYPDALFHYPEFEDSIAEQPSSQFPSASGDARLTNHALQDYSYQLMLLEQQNKARLRMAQKKQQEQAAAQFKPLQDYQHQLRLLEKANKVRLLKAREEHVQEKAREAWLEQRNVRRLATTAEQELFGLRDEQEREAAVAAVGKLPNDSAAPAMVSRMSSSPSSYYTYIDTKD